MMYSDSMQQQGTPERVQAQSRTAFNFLHGYESMRNFPPHLRRQIDNFLLNPLLYSLRPTMSATDYLKFLGSGDLDKLKFWTSSPSLIAKWAVYSSWTGDWVFVIQHETGASRTSHLNKKGAAIILPSLEQDDRKLNEKMPGTRNWLVWQSREWPELNIWSFIDTTVNLETVGRENIANPENDAQAGVTHKSAQNSRLKDSNHSAMESVNGSDRVFRRFMVQQNRVPNASSESSNQLGPSAASSTAGVRRKIITLKYRKSDHQQLSSPYLASNASSLSKMSLHQTTAKQSHVVNSKLTRAKLGHSQVLSTSIGRKRPHETVEDNHSISSSLFVSSDCMQGEGDLRPKSYRRANNKLSKPTATDKNMCNQPLPSRDTNKLSSPSVTMPLTPIDLDTYINAGGPKRDARVIDRTETQSQLDSMGLRRRVTFHFKKSASDIHPRIRPDSMVNSASRLFMQASSGQVLTRGAEILSIQVGDEPSCQFNVMKDNEEDYLRIVDAVNRQQKLGSPSIVVTVMPADI